MKTGGDLITIEVEAVDSFIGQEGREVLIGNDNVGILKKVISPDKLVVERRVRLQPEMRE